MPLYYVCSQCPNDVEVLTVPGETLEVPEGWSIGHDDSSIVDLCSDCVAELESTDEAKE